MNTILKLLSIFTIVFYLSACDTDGSGSSEADEIITQLGIAWLIYDRNDDDGDEVVYNGDTIRYDSGSNITRTKFFHTGLERDINVYVRNEERFDILVEFNKDRGRIDVNLPKNYNVKDHCHFTGNIEVWNIKYVI